jgi:hypothetical protein
MWHAVWRLFLNDCSFDSKILGVLPEKSRVHWVKAVRVQRNELVPEPVLLFKGRVAVCGKQRTGFRGHLDDK